MVSLTALQAFATNRSKAFENTFAHSSNWVQFLHSVEVSLIGLLAVVVNDPSGAVGIGVIIACGLAFLSYVSVLLGRATAR